MEEEIRADGRKGYGLRDDQGTPEGDTSLRERECGPQGIDGGEGLEDQNAAGDHKKKPTTVGEKKAIVRRYASEGLGVDKGLALVGLSRNQYYHRRARGTRRPGRPISECTMKYIDETTREVVPNKEVVEQIEKVLEDPDTQYGYKRMTAAMMLLGYMIGRKKVYRLMKENGLLRRRIRPTGKNRVRGRKVQPTRPLEILSMDIKQVWVEEHARSAYILNIIDTFTRTILYKSSAYHMTQYQVRAAWEHVIEHYLQPADLKNKGLAVEIRNDNGPQFAATMVREFLAENGLNQVFTYPYCPEQNGHVESFHAILSEHLNRFYFDTLEQLQDTLELFYEKYNSVRLHGSIACLPPLVFWQLWSIGMVKMHHTEKGKTIFKISVPYWKLSGKGFLREFPLSKEAKRAS